MAAKELAARQKHEQLAHLAQQTEKAKQDAVSAGREQAEAVRQSFRVS